MFKELGIKNIITGIFVIGAIIALLVFSGLIKIGGNNNAASGQVVVWGTIPFSTMQRYVEQAKTKNINITYKKQDDSSYETDLVNAFAAGNGPDLFIMPHESILRHADKIFEIPYKSFPKDKYEATYIDEAKLFLTKTGSLAIPLSVDPLVMYYNKQLVSSAFLIDIPKYWDELTQFTSDITVSDANGTLSVSGVALGTYDNIDNAKGILSTMFIQNDNNIVGTDPLTTKKRSEITLSEDLFKKSQQTLDFYTSFSHVGNENYSWNEALASSRNKFISGELALYFGKASEIEKISKKNPNLDFNVALIPQISETSIKSTYGSMLGVAIAKQSKNIPAAITIASKLTGNDISKGLTHDLLVMPTRKDLLRNKPDDSHLTLFYNSAIISKGWLDADRKATDFLFKSLVRSINTGSLNVSDALRRANADLNIILNRTINTIITDESTKQ